MVTVHGPTPSTRAIALAGVIGALYAVLTLGFAPIGYGPVQFRIGSLMKPAALLNRWVGWGIMVGVGLANIASPFGPWDWFAMPLVSLLGAEIAYQLRRWPIAANLAHAALIAAGVACLPLYMGAGIPIWPTLLFVFASEAMLYLIGWFVIWRRFTEWDSPGQSSL